MKTLCGFVVALLLLTLTPSLQSAPTNFWVNTGSGSWSEPTNWDRGVAPVPGDESRISNGGTGIIDNSQQAATQLLSIGPTNGTSGTLRMTGGRLTTTSDIRVGGNSSAAGGIGVFEQSGGDVIMNGGNLNVGYGTNSVGVYSLSNGSLQMNAAAPIFAIGNRECDGSATINQSGGSIYLRTNGLTQLGRNTVSVPASGTFNLSGGTLATSRLQFGNAIGTNGTPTNVFNLSSNGVLMVGSISNINPAAINIFNFTGGTLSLMTCAIPLTNRGGIFSPAFIDFTNAAGTNLAALPVSPVATNVFIGTNGYVQLYGTLLIDIAGQGNNDVLDIGAGTNVANATIHDSIVVRFVDGYSPSVGNSFDIVAADSISVSATVFNQSGAIFSRSVVPGSDGRQVLRLSVTRPPIVPARLVGLAKPDSSSFRFSFTNFPECVFFVSSRTNVTAGWSWIGNANETAPGHYEFTDAQAAGGQRFYRVTGSILAP